MSPLDKTPEIVLARAAFERQTEKKHPLTDADFDARIKDAEAAIDYATTDFYDVRQRMSGLCENPHLNPDQQERVKKMRAKLLHCLIDNGLIDGWGVAE